MPAPVAGEYWLVDPDNSDNNVRLSNVTSENFSEEWEQATLNIIGKGRKTDYGTRWGYSGQLVAQVWGDEGRTASQARAQLELLKALQKTVILWTPFGEQWAITMGTAQIGRMAGVGTQEFHTLTLDYHEVVSEV